MYETNIGLFGHKSCVMVSRYLGNSIVATGGLDKVMNVWNIENGNLIKTFTGHKDCITGICSLSGSLVVTSSDDKSLILWDIHGVSGIRCYDEHTASVTCIYACMIKGPVSKSLGNTHNMFVSGSSDKCIKFWNDKKGKSLFTLNKSNAPIRSLYVKDDEENPLLISGSNSNELLIWSLKTLDLLRKFSSHQDPITGIAKFSKDIYVTTSMDKTICLWKSNFEDEPERIRENGGFINSLAVMGRYILISTAFSMIEIWDGIKKEKIDTINLMNQIILGVYPLDSFRVAVNIGNHIRIFSVLDPKVITLSYLETLPLDVRKIKKIYNLLY